jgi:hypothetical protein
MHTRHFTENHPVDVDSEIFNDEEMQIAFVVVHLLQLVSSASARREVGIVVPMSALLRAP